MKFESAPSPKQETAANAELVSDFQEKEASFLGTLSGKAGRMSKALVFATALAGISACGNNDNPHDFESSTPQTSEQSTDQKKRYTKAEWDARIAKGIYSDNPAAQARMMYGSEKAQKFREKNTETLKRAHELAAQMGIPFDANNHKINIRTEGHEITYINGEKVPDHLLTDAEKKSIASARRMREMMGNPSSLKNTQTKSREISPVVSGEDNLDSDYDILQGTDIDTSQY